jgi:hypothetical protein
MQQFVQHELHVAQRCKVLAHDFSCSDFGDEAAR